MAVLIQGPFSNASVDGKYDVVIKSTTGTAYLLGRTNVADQENLKPTQTQMFSYKLSTVKNNFSPSEDGKPPIPPINRKTPVEKIFSMNVKEFFETFAELMVSNPPVLPQDINIVTLMKAEYGLTAGEPWQFNNLSAKQKQELSVGMNNGANLLRSYPVKKVNGWTVPNMNTGKFGTDYYLRAYIGLVLYAANVPQDSVYFVSEMMPNEGRVYELEFNPESGGTPPTNQFWSMTLYSEDGYLVANQYKRYSISSQQKLKYGADGSVHVTISMAEPADLSTTNWLPAPQAGEAFQLTLRVYWPKDEVLATTWVPPALKEVSTPPTKQHRTE